MSAIVGSRRRYRWWRDNLGVLYVLPWLVGFIVLQLFPFIASLAISFTKWDFGGAPVFIGFDNYRRMIADPLVLQSVVNTIYYTVLSVPSGLAVAFLLAVLLNQHVRGIAIYRTAFYLPSVTAGVATSIIWVWLLQPNGLANKGLSLFGIHGPPWLVSPTWALPALVIVSLWSVGGSMVLFLAGLQGIPQGLYDAVAIDGGGHFAKFFHVTIPMMTPYFFLTSVLGIIGSFQVFTSALVMTQGGPAGATTFIVLLMYWEGWQWWRMGYASAIAWALLVVILFFTAVQFRLARSWVYYEYGRPESGGS